MNEHIVRTTIPRSHVPSLLTLLLLLIPGLTRAETVVQAWAQRYNGPWKTTDYAYAMAVDLSNSVIVVGISYGTESTSAGGSDYAIIKYSSAGLPLWTNSYNGPGNSYDCAYAVTVDGSNNVIVTGSSYGIVSGPDYATVKYSSAGVPLWTNRFSGVAVGSPEDSALAVAADGNNDVVVTGRAYNGARIDFATIKYSSAGVPLWTNLYDLSGGSAYAGGVAVDGNNDVVITGSSYASGSGFDYTTIKYLSTGIPIWTNRYNGPANGADNTGYVAVDGSNNVVVAGTSPGVGTDNDYATIKYSRDGVPLWTNRYNSPWNGRDDARSLALDRSGDVIVTGYSMNGSGSFDIATVKYSGAGVPLWTNRCNGPARFPLNSTCRVAADGSNNVIVTGTSFSSASTNDYLTIKYSSTGALLWTVRYNGPANGNDETSALAIDSSNNVIVAGYSTSGGSDCDFATMKYVSVPSPVLTGRMTNGAFRVRVDNILQPGTLVLQASTNLRTWAPVFTNTVATNVVYYTEPDARNKPALSYRAFQFP
jgi:hypothetical protein